MGGEELRIDRHVERLRSRKPTPRRKRRRRVPSLRRILVASTLAILAATYVLPPLAGKLLIAGAFVMAVLRPWRRLRQTARPVVIGVFLACGAPVLLPAYPLGFRLLLFIGVAAAAVAMYEWGVPD